MAVPLVSALAEVLADSERLLATTEPGLADWQDYGRRRSELFERLQNTPAAAARSGLEADALGRLYARVLENDRLLMAKIGRHLSEISRELENLAEQRRLFKAYRNEFPPQTVDRVTA